MSIEQINQTNFLNFIQLAFFDPNQEIRKAHEQSLMLLMQNSPDNFVNFCVSFFNKTNIDISLRRTISTILKLAIKPTIGNEALSVWQKISDQTKISIQECGLMNLIDDDENIRNAAASLVADAFVCDCLFEKKWVDLLSNLSSNLNHEDPSIQKSSILTLGYICEVLHQQKITCLSNEQIDALITGVCLGLKNYDHKTLTALRALENSMNFLVESVKKETVSDFIMNLLVTILIQANDNKNEPIIRQCI